MTSWTHDTRRAPGATTVKLFLDDNREPPDDSWTVARTADEAISAINLNRSCGFNGPGFEEMMFDHDLGHCKDCEGCNGWKSPCGCRCHLTGYFVVCWMETEDIWPKTRPTCHSRNPVGKAKIEAAIRRKYEQTAPEAKGAG